MYSSLQRLEELRAAEHSFELVLSLAFVEARDLRVSRVAGNLLDPEVARGERRDLRQVRDRDHLRALAGAREGPADRVGRLAADAGVDLVEDEGHPARDDGDRERNPRELATRCRVGDWGHRQSGIGTDQELHLVGPGHSELPFTEQRLDLTSAHSQTF